MLRQQCRTIQVPAPFASNQKTFEGMKISKIRGYEHGDTGHIEIRIKNETGSKVEAQEVKVAFFDTNNKNIGKAYIYTRNEQ